MSLRLALQILTITLCWGYTWLTMKMGLAYMEPLTFTFFRFFSGTIVLFIILHLKKIGLPSRKDVPYLALAGLVQFLLVYVFVMYGMRFVTAGKSSILFYTMPVWNLLFSWLFLRERLSLRKIIGVLLGLAGLFSIMGWDVFVRMQDAKVLWGEFLIVCGGVSFAVANILMKTKLANRNVLQVTAWQMLVGSAGLLAAVLLFEGGGTVEWNAVSVFSVLFSGVLGSALSFVVWYAMLGDNDSTVASASILLVPVFSLLLGWLQLGERMEWGTVMGMLFIIACIWLVNSRERSGADVSLKGGETR